jgi:hypothetical protein
LLHSSLLSSLSTPPRGGSLCYFAVVKSFIHMCVIGCVHVCVPFQVAASVSGPVLEAHLAAITALSEARLAGQMEEQKQQAIRRELERLQVWCALPHESWGVSCACTTASCGAVVQ